MMITCTKIIATNRGYKKVTIDFDPKIWQSKEIIHAADMNRIEQGIADGTAGVNELVDLLETYALKSELTKKVLIDSTDFDVSSIGFAEELDFAMVETTPAVTYEWFGITTEGNGFIWRYNNSEKYLMIVYTEGFQIAGANWNNEDTTKPYVTNMINLNDTVTQGDLTAVQEQITNVSTALEQHKVSGDHDDRYYTQDIVDNKIQEIVQSLIWHSSVPTFADLETTYPDPRSGWTVAVDDENTVYRYNGTEWEPLFKVLLNIVTEDNDGLMTSEMLAQLIKATADILTKAPINHASATNEYGLASGGQWGHTALKDNINGSAWGINAGYSATPKAVYDGLQAAMAYTLEQINEIKTIDNAKQLTDAINMPANFDPLNDVEWQGENGIVPVISTIGGMTPWDNSAAGFLIKHTNYMCTVWLSRSNISNNNSDYAYRKFYYNSTTGDRSWGNWQTDLTKEIANTLYPPIMHTSPVGQVNPYGTGSAVAQGHVSLVNVTDSSWGSDQGTAATPLAVRNAKEEAIEASREYTDSLAHTHIVELDADGNLSYPNSITDMETNRVDIILFSQDAVTSVQNDTIYTVRSSGSGNITRISAKQWDVIISYWGNSISSSTTRLSMFLQGTINLQEDGSLMMTEQAHELLAKMYHATSSTLYGLGTTALYGHTKVSDAIDGNNRGGGVAATPKAVYDGMQSSITQSKAYTDEQIEQLVTSHVVTYSNDEVVYPESIRNMDVGNIETILYTAEAIQKIIPAATVRTSGNGSVTRLSQTVWNVFITFNTSHLSIPVIVAYEATIAMQEDETMQVQSSDYKHYARYNHASSNSDFGKATDINFGHVKLTDSLNADYQMADTIAATPYLVNAKIAAAIEGIEPGGSAKYPNGIVIDDGDTFDPASLGLDDNEMIMVRFTSTGISSIVSGRKIENFVGILTKDGNEYEVKGTAVEDVNGYQTISLGLYFNSVGDWEVYEPETNDTIVIEEGPNFPIMTSYEEKTCLLLLSPAAVQKIFGGSYTSAARGVIRISSGTYARCQITYSGYNDYALYSAWFDVNKETGEINPETFRNTQLVDTESAREMYAPINHVDELGMYGEANEYVYGHVKKLDYIDTSEETTQDQRSAVSAAAVISYMFEKMVKYARIQRNGTNAPFSFSTGETLNIEINAAEYKLETYNSMVQTVNVAAQSIEWVEDAKLIINADTGVIRTGTYEDVIGGIELYIIGTCVWARGGTVQAVYIDGYDLVENTPATINQSMCYMLSWGVTTPLVNNENGTWTLASGSYIAIDMSTAQRYTIQSTGVTVLFDFAEVLYILDGQTDIKVSSVAALPDGAKIIGGMNRQGGQDVVMINGMLPLVVTNTTE